ncbi:alpha/beta fold hydrolase [Actinoplanes nipponensis]|uniref:alpha/beta fold hydrolase n=1 Tax=Actinoplanes nipponensis TaxID=135950 RepID=UPI0034DB28F3
MADLVAAFLDELGLARPELAGSSLGGGIALELGPARPGGGRHRVRAGRVLGSGEPALVPDGGRWGARAEHRARPRAPPPLRHPGRPRRALRDLLRPPRPAVARGLPGLARALSRAPASPPPGGRSASGGCRSGADPGALGGIPVTIAWGTRDLVLPHRRQAARARAELPAARHVVLPGCGHLPFADDPARCAELLTVRQ